MARGARSIRGAMRSYARTGFVAVMVLAIVLWIGGPETERSFVSLPADSAWQSAALDDGRQLLTVERGGRVEAPPGRYVVTLHDAEGGTQRRTLEVEGALTVLD